MATRRRLAKMIADGKIPPMLYKYRSLSEQYQDDKGKTTMDYTLDILTTHSLYFATPNSFNDPFDCKIYPTEEPDKDLSNFLADNQNVVKGITASDIKERINSVNITKIKQEAIDNVMNRVGICCMTGKKDNLLMWSHYADSHKGICLGFDVMQAPDFFNHPICMDYVKDYPRIALTKDKEYIQALLKSKFEDWGYEQEVRIFQKEGGKTYPFIPTSLKQIFFGCKTTQEHINRIQKIIEKTPELHHVELYKAEIDNKSYRLNMNRIP